jgi:hypothetical protein
MISKGNDTSFNFWYQNHLNTVHGSKVIHENVKFAVRNYQTPLVLS